jgi:hypothetical protein
MTCDAVLTHVLDLLQRQRRVSYCTVKRCCDLDDGSVEQIRVGLDSGE